MSGPAVALRPRVRATALRPGLTVRASIRTRPGVVLCHHPNLPAWIVDFPGDTYLAWYDAELEVVA